MGKGWDWDIGQWFTPPKSKTPWTAMTEGSGGGWAKGVEPWGPLINSILKFIPVVGQVGSVVGGGIGMEGRGTGFQGSDYGWKGNAMPTLTGAMSGLYSNPISGAYKGLGSYVDNGNSPMGGYNMTYDRKNDPYGDKFDISQVGSMIGNVAGNYFGNGMWGNVGSRIGGQMGQGMENSVYGSGNATPQTSQQSNTQLPQGQVQTTSGQAAFAKQQQEAMKKQEEEEKLKKLLMAMQLMQLNQGDNMKLPSLQPQMGGMYGI